MSHVPRNLDDCYSILDLRELARRRLPPPVFDYLDGAAETEITAHWNTAAFDDDKLIPRCLIDVSSIRTSTRVLGQQLAWPVFCSPTGASRFYHPDGEPAVARATAAAGTLYSLSVAATHSIEEVAAASSGPKMFQVLSFKDREVTYRMIERCRQAGYQALCLTVDAMVRGKRERELRTGLGLPLKLTARSAASFAMYPRWFLRQAGKGPFSMPNIAPGNGSNRLAEQTQYLSEQLDPFLTWKEVRGLIEQWAGPFALKGVMAVEDAQRAVDVGATAIIVSNHGGRQLDGAAAPIEVLPEIARAVGDRIEVILDGGVRRGGHVLKALARGAKACSIGRPYLFGLAAGGEAGVSRALDILRTEFVRAMQLCGCVDAQNIDADVVRRF